MNSPAPVRLNQTAPPVALIMAGGTGGHIFPGLAVAEELKANGWNLHWLGSNGGMEEKLVPKHHISMSLIAVSGLRGNGILGWLKAPFSLLLAIYQAVRVVNKISPNIVIGFGGFASGPGGFASALLRKKLFIHEQNAIAGLTNRLLSKWADKVYQAFPETFKPQQKIETIGNPIRKQIRCLDKQINKKESNKPLNILVVGGSRGAQALNQALPEIFADYIEQGKITVRHQAGDSGYLSTTAAYEKLRLKEPTDVQVHRFIEDMAQAYLWADVVICRAGALTVSEIAAVGIAAIFVPYPFAVDDHQTANARWLADQDAAVIIPQAQLLTEQSRQLIHSLFDDKSRIQSMATKAKQRAFLDATDIIACACNSSLEEVA